LDGGFLEVNAPWLCLRAALFSRTPCLLSSTLHKTFLNTRSQKMMTTLAAVTCGYRYLVMWEQKLSLILLLIFSLKHKAAQVGPCPM